MRVLIVLAAVLAATPLLAQSADDGEAAADVAARAALPRAVVRTIRSEIRTIQGLNGAVAGGERTISGDVVGIASAQRSLAAEGLATRMVNGSLEVSLPGDVLFDFDKASIRANAIPTLEKVQSAAKATGDRPIKVEGHTDAVGTKAHNQALSEARARSVADWLASAGVPKSRLTSVGFGATRPIAQNRSAAGADDPAGRQRNRRVTIIL